MGIGCLPVLHHIVLEKHHLTAYSIQQHSLKLRYQLYKMDTKWYGNFLSINLAKRPLIKTLSKALLASRKAQWTLLPPFVKYFIESTKVNSAWLQLLFIFLETKLERVTYQTRICAAEMAVRYAALSACRKVHVCYCNSLGGATWRSVTITGRTDRQTDRQSATQYAAPS